MENNSAINVFSYNIWTDSGTRQGRGSFAARIPLFREKFLAYKPDLIGFQETMPYQRQWLMDNLEGFEVVGVGRGKNYDNESNVIAYRKDRFDLVFLETFWLSDTPHKPGSLAHILTILSFYDMNLTRIQSLPIPGREWQYFFYADIKFSDYERYSQALTAVRPLIEDLDILGEYPSSI